MISSDGSEAALSADIEHHPSSGRDGSEYGVAEFYEVDRVANWIRGAGFSRVALQFPDELLSDSASVTWSIEEKLRNGGSCTTSRATRLFVAGDTSYGSCCVDEVTAQHYGADAIVHFGRACLSPTASSLPVLYIFGKRGIDASHAAESLMSILRDRGKVILLYDVMYLHAIPDISAKVDGLKPDGGVVIVGRPREGWAHHEEEDNLADKRARVGGLAIAGLRLGSIASEEELREHSIFFIGSEGRQLSNTLLRCGGCGSKYSYNPELQDPSRRLRDESMGGNRDLMRRYYLIQKAKEADIIGIVMGTLGVKAYDAVLDSVRSALVQHGRKSYTFSVGKVNPAKLANFAEVGAFCLVSCGENALLDSRDFHAPVITPFELEIALGIREWDGYNSTAFEELRLIQQPDVYLQKPAAALGDEDGDAPYFSLVSGEYKSQKNVAQNGTMLGHEQGRKGSVEGGREIVSAESGGQQLSTFVSPAADFLKKREYRGLVMEEDLPAHEAMEGSSGIASDLGGR